MKVDARSPEAGAHPTDVIVVGGGLSGLAAALRAAELGLAATVLERAPDPRYVCNSRLTGGIFHVALDGILDPPARLVERIQAATDGTAQPELAEAVAGDALRTVRWLQSQGVRFMRSGRDPWQTFTLAPPSLPQFGRRWQGRAGDVLLRTLEARLTARGGRLLRGHRALELTMRDGRCTGLIGERDDGSRFAVQAGAVVIADGGFQADPDLLATHVTPQPDRLRQRNAQTGRGDGLAMARAAGAAVTDLAPFYGHLLSRDALTNELLWPFPWADDVARAAIVVGPDGRRFADEGIGGVYLANRVARLRDPASAVAVFDDATWQGPGRLRAMSANPFLVRAGGTLYSADTLATLAAMAGLPIDALTDEVARYNRAHAAGALSALAPPRTTPRAPALPILRAPFHALPIVAGITYTMGGIRIDGDTRVLDTAGVAIPGLHAVGAATGGLEGGPRCGYVGGLIKAGVTGLRAGERIASDLAPARAAA